jgi:hypothetical protein
MHRPAPGLTIRYLAEHTSQGLDKCFPVHIYCSKVPLRYVPYTKARQASGPNSDLQADLSITLDNSVLRDNHDSDVSGGARGRSPGLGLSWSSLGYTKLPPRWIWHLSHFRRCCR